MSIPDWKLEARQLNKGIHGVDGWIVYTPPKTDRMAAINAGQEVTTRRIAVLESSYYLTIKQAEEYAKLFADAPALRSRVEALEGVVRNLVREGTAIIAAVQSGSDSAQETAALDWLDTVEDALALLATPANGEPGRKESE